MAGRALSSMLTNREIKTKLPSIASHSKDETQVRKTDKEEKEKLKKYKDSKRKAKRRNLKIGDKVLVFQKHKNKISTNFPNPIDDRSF